MKGIKRITVFIIFFAVLAIFTGAVAAADWNVTAGSNIQTAINNASENDTVIVNDNNGTAYTYIENVVINKKINLQAASDLVTIQGLNSSKPVITINSKGTGSTIQNFIITGATSSSGIYLNSANNCLIAGNDLTGNYYGIQLYKSTNNNITNNTISNNTNMGIYINTNSTNNYIQNNNLTTNPYGMYILNSINNQIIANTIENSTSYAIYTNNIHNTIINQNSFTNNNYGIYLYNAQANAITDNTITNSRIGIYVNTNSNNNNIQTNTLIGNQYGINTYNSQNNALIGNTIIYTTYYGIYLYNCTQTTVNLNTINFSNSTGIYLNTGSNGNYIQNNFLTSNPYGIYITNSINNQIMANTINNSTSYAIYANNINSTNITSNNLTNNNYGIYLYNAQNNSLTENTLLNNIRIAIYLNTNSNNNNIQNNTLTNNQYGINTYNSSNNTITQNIILNTSYYGVYLFNSVQNTISQNTINNSTKTGIYLNTNSNNNYILNNILTSNLCGLYIINCFNNTLSGNELKNSSSYAFYLKNVNNTVIGQNNITNNNYGLYLYNSQNNTINQNTLYNNTRIGIYVNTNSNNNYIQNNTLIGNQYGINTYNSQNNIIIGNSISNTTYYGIYFSNSTQSTITENTINNSNSTGIFLNTNSSNNSIQNNTVSGNKYGIYLNSNSNDNYLQNNSLTLNQYGTYLYITQNNIITSNTINNNTYDGIYLYNSSALINFNSIAGNGRYGLYKVGNGTVNAYNNWWGSNSPKVSSAIHSDIYMPGSMVNNDPWLVLNVTTSPPVTNDNSTISVDLTHNNKGGDTSSSGNIPDGIPVNFATDLGTITNISYTKNGRANGTFNRDSTTSGTANITISLDNETVYTSVIIDATAPNVSASLVGGVYDTPIYVSLNAVDDLDPNPVIYFTTDGSDPTTSSNQYTSPLHITSINTILKFMAVDQTGNQATITTENYILNVPIININTANVYSTIQNAIDDPSTLDGDIIEINTGTYIENVIINKKITIRSAFDHDTVVQAADYNNNVFTITQAGSGTTIQGLSITGGADGIYLDNATGCQIIANTIYYNNNGIHLYNSHNNSITENNLNDNYEGIFLDYSPNNTIYENNITEYNFYGICLYNSSNNLFSYNNILNNHNGLKIINSSENTLRNNSLGDWDTEFDIKGSCIHDFIQDIDQSNTINGNPIYYLIEQNDLVFDRVPMGFLALISCDNITVVNYPDDPNSKQINGILLVNTNHSTIQNKTINTCYLLNSSNNIISGTYTSKISLESSNNNTISANDVSNGICLLNSSENLISDNFVTGGSGPVSQVSLMDNGFDSYSTSSNNIDSSIYLESSSNNIITNNHIFSRGGGPVARALSINSDYDYLTSNSYTSNRAIHLISSLNNTISENSLEGRYQYGIGLLLETSPYNTITGNNISNYYYGLYLQNSSENILRTNELYDNKFNFGVSGNNTSEYIQDIDTSNTINGNAIYYLVGQNGQIFDGTPIGYLALISCDGIEVKNITLSNNAQGALVVNTINSIIENCNISEFSETGIYILNSSNNTFSMNNLESTSGMYFSTFYLEQSYNNTISQNNITGGNSGDNHGIYLLSSYQNLISENLLYDIYLESSYENNIIGNSVSESIVLYYSTYNQILDNNVHKMVVLFSSNNILSQNTISNYRVQNGVTGIYLESSNNNTISDNNVTGDADIPWNTTPYGNIYHFTDTYGIVLNLSYGNIIRRNNISGQYKAINIEDSGNNQIDRNSISCNVYCFDYQLALCFWDWESYGISITGLSFNNIIHENNITNLEYGIYFHIVSNNTILDNNIISCEHGIVFEGSSENIISGNNLFNGWIGIYFDPIWSGLECNNNMISGNHISNHDYGICLNSAPGSIFIENTIDNNELGIRLESSPNSIISRNNITNTCGDVIDGLDEIIAIDIKKGDLGGFGTGITLESSPNTLISDNTVSNNSVGGIYIPGSSSFCTISGNTVTDNGNNILVTGTYQINMNYNRINGIFIEGNNAIISENTVNHNGVNTYIWADLMPGCALTGNGCNGILVTGSNAIVTNNTANDNGADGINVRSDNVRIIENTAGNNVQDGIDVSGLDYVISGNTANYNGGMGISVDSDGVIVSENIATENNGTGILVNGNNAIITPDNIIHNNGGTALYVRGDNINLSGFNIYNNGGDGINIAGLNSLISGNTITSNGGTGISVNGDGAIISENTVSGNQYGIYLSSSSANIKFNRIVGNSLYGLYIASNGVINATNNWWGTNNPIVSSSSPTDIYIASGTVNYNLWLVLNISANPTSTNSSSTITADVTHNNAGDDTSPQGNIPDNSPITFITNIGTIISPVNIRNGKASTTFDHGTSILGLANITATLDNQTVQTNVTKPLTLTVSQVGGLYNTIQNITLTPIEQNKNSTIYFTIDGSDPQVNGIVYSNPITINITTTLRYCAVDPEGNWGPEYGQNYIIDLIPPTVTINIKGGVYNTTQIINLTVTDNLDPNPVIYFTTDGTSPTTSSTVFTSPITLEMNLTIRNITFLKFMAVDQAGNQAQIQTETFILTLPVVDTDTNKTYSLIQDAINDNSTLTGDVIQIYSGIYTETVTVNKEVVIMAVYENNVTIQAADPNGNVFIITNDGNGSVITGFTVDGSISLQGNNSTIYLNTIIANGTSGIITSNSFNNTIMYNTITCNGYNGIQSNSSSNVIYGNIISGCESGIYSEESNNNITSNNIISNQYGIWTNNSTDTIHFNRITQNTYGLRNDLSMLNATNNWWGTNYPNTNDIWIESGNVTYNPWLLLSVNPSSTNSGGNISVTADLTHNNQGEDTSSQCYIPDSVPVNFTSDTGNIVNTAYTIKGQSTTILNLNTTESQNVTVSASFDNQTVNATGLIATGLAVLSISSSAIDNSTGQPLNFTYNLNLNNSVTWLSIVWIPVNGTSVPTDEIQVILDGIVVEDTFIYNNMGGNVDIITFNISYPGVNGFNLTVTDPSNNNDVTNLNFPGNNITRTSTILYKGSPYDGLMSFAIATTDVTLDILNYWLNQTSTYQNQSIVLYAAFSSFLEPLLLEYAHDQTADNSQISYNVTWARTSPIIVSVCDDATEAYLTLDCDHSMGMTVTGSPDNMRAFNFMCSYLISPFEYEIMSSIVNATGNSNYFYQSYSNYGYFGSVTLDLLYHYLMDNSSVETFIENGYLIEKNTLNDNEFLILDPETGICRDINTVNNFCGAYSPDYPITYTDLGNIAGDWSNPIAEPGVIGLPFGSTLIYGPFNFNWDGYGHVYITGGYWFWANHNPYYDPYIYTVGSMLIQINNETMGPLGNENTYNNFNSRDIDITNLLQNGTNSITITIKSTASSWLGGIAIANGFIWAVESSLPVKDFRLFPVIVNANTIVDYQVSNRTDKITTWNGKYYTSSWFDPENVYPDDGKPHYLNPLRILIEAIAWIPVGKVDIDIVRTTATATTGHFVPWWTETNYWSKIRPSFPFL